MRASILSAALLAALTAAPLAAQIQEEVWVDATSGKDTNPGTQALPFKTLSKAFNYKKLDLKVHVLPGVYGPKTTGDFWDATANKQKAERLVDYKNWSIVGTDVDKCIIDLAGNSGEWYGYVEVKGNATDGVEIANLTWMNAGSSPWANGPLCITNAAKNVSVHGCKFIDANSAIIAWGGFDLKIYSNLFYNTAAAARTGVAIRCRNQYQNKPANGDRVYVFNNTFDNLNHALSYDNEPTFQWFANNLIVNCNTGFPGSAAPKNLVIENNNVFGCTTDYAYAVPASNTKLDPMLVDQSKNDYRLKATSPLLDGGITKGLVDVINDFAGNARAFDINEDGKAMPDVGAYESVTIELALVKDWGQGKTPIFAFSGDTSKNPTSLWFMAWQKSGSKSWPIFTVDPVGSWGLDLTAILWNSFSPVPSPANWKPMPFPLPVDKNLTGLPLYFQGLAIRAKVGGGVVFKPSGRLTLHM